MKIKIEREEKLDLAINGIVYLVGSLYYVKEGENRNHAYILKKIIRRKEWILDFGNGIEYDADIGDYHLDKRPDRKSFRKCDCSFICEGYVLKEFTWN